MAILQGPSAHPAHRARLTADPGGGCAPLEHCGALLSPGRANQTCVAERSRQDGSSASNAHEDNRHRKRYGRLPHRTLAFAARSDGCEWVLPARGPSPGVSVRVPFETRITDSHAATTLGRAPWPPAPSDGPPAPLEQVDLRGLVFHHERPEILAHHAEVVEVDHRRGMHPVHVVAAARSVGAPLGAHHPRLLLRLAEQHALVPEETPKMRALRSSLLSRRLNVTRSTHCAAVNGSTAAANLRDIGAISADDGAGLRRVWRRDQAPPSRVCRIGAWALRYMQSLPARTWCVLFENLGRGVC